MQNHTKNYMKKKLFWFFWIHPAPRYFTPATSGSSSPPAAAAAIKQDIFPFLGLGAFPQGFPGLPPGLLAGLPPGFNPFLPQDKAAGGASGPLTPPLPPLKRARDQVATDTPFPLLYTSHLTPHSPPRVTRWTSQRRG